MNFEEWLEADGMSISTIKKYAGAIRGPLTTWANSYQLTERALEEIVDPDEFSDIAERVADTPEFAVRNRTGHQMYSAALQKYATFLSTINDAVASAPGPWAKELATITTENQTHPAFDPADQTDARKMVLSEVVRRQGQSKFRAGLIKAYEARCAFTDCTVLPTLEAAHITPYLGAATNRTENGLLLRADIHTLWDLGLMAIHPDTNLIFVAPTIFDDSYRGLHGKPPFVPLNVLSKPAPAALQQQWRIFTKV